MPEGGNVLSDQAIRVLKEAVAELNRIKQGKVELTPSLSLPDLNDHQAPEVYVALVPAGGIPARDGDYPGEADCDIYRMIWDNNNVASLEALESTFKTVYNLSGSDLSEGDYVIVGRDKFGSWYVFGSGGGSTTEFWARLIYKTHGSAYIAYSWIKVTDSDSPSPITWLDTVTEGGPGNYPAYEVNNIDLPTSNEIGTGTGTGTGTSSLPIPMIVRLRKGIGSYYLIDQTPRWEFVRKTGNTPDANGYYPGTLLRWDQGSKSLVQHGIIKIKDLNAP